MSDTLIGIKAETLEAVKAQICDNYCKYPSLETSYEDPDWFEDQCSRCPLNLLETAGKDKG